MRRHLTRLLVLPTILLSTCVIYGQGSTDPKLYRKEIERLREMADSLQSEAKKLESEFSTYAETVYDSLSLWSKKFSDSLTHWAKDLFPDSLFKKFQFDSRQFFVPDKAPEQWKLPDYPYPRYFNDPRLPGIPYPDSRNQWDERNNELLPRVIPKRRDGKELPNFPGWRIQKLKNLAKA